MPETPNDTSIDQALDDLVHVLPLFQRKLFRMDLGGLTEGLTRHHLFIMKLLSESCATASDVAKVTELSRPQVTHLIDQLVAKDIVERQPDTKDRRVINLVMTVHGRSLFESVHQKVRENTRQKLSSLTTEERVKVLAAIRTLKDISARL